MAEVIGTGAKLAKSTRRHLNERAMETLYYLQNLNAVKDNLIEGKRHYVVVLNGIEYVVKNKKEAEYFLALYKDLLL